MKIRHPRNIGERKLIAGHPFATVAQYGFTAQEIIVCAANHVVNAFAREAVAILTPEVLKKRAVQAVDDVLKRLFRGSWAMLEEKLERAVFQRQLRFVGMEFLLLDSVLAPPPAKLLFNVTK